MSPFAQQLLVYGIVLAAAGWLLRRWLHRSRRSSCDRCGPGSSPMPRKGIRPRSLRVLR